MSIKAREAIDLVVAGRTPEDVYKLMTEDGTMGGSPNPGAASASPSPSIQGSPSPGTKSPSPGTKSPSPSPSA
jgi:hypothetical protein